MKIRTFFALTSACLALASCLDPESAFESESAIDFDKVVVAVAADPCIDTLNVIANRGWSIVEDSPCDWVELSTMEHVNLVGATETTPLEIKIADNPVKENREWSFRIIGEGFSRTVYIEQKAVVYRLSVSSPLKVEDLDDRGTTVPVVIETNGTWAAHVKGGSTATVTFEKDGGYRSDTLFVNLGTNKDKDNGKNAVVVIEVPDCEPVEVELVQKAAVPYISTFVAEQERYLDPEMFSCLGGNRNFSVSSNVKWTAAVNTAETTATGVVLTTTSGDGDLSKFLVTVKDFNPSWTETRKVVIDFSYNGEVLCKKEFTQQKGSIVRFEFRDQDNTTSYWPFAVPASNPGSSNKGTGYFETANGLRIGYYGTDSAYLYSQGLQCGATAGCYFEMPAVEGHRLIRITTVDYNGSTKPYICDAEGVILKGGEYSTEFGKMIPFTWNLENSLPGVAYRMYCGTAKTLRINNLELEYE